MSRRGQSQGSLHTGLSLRHNIGILGLSITAQLSRDLVLILLLGFGSALDVVKASTAIQIYLFTTMASAAANHFHGTKGARVGDYFVVYAAFAILAQYFLFDLVVAPGFTGEKLEDARFYGHIALFVSLMVMPYAVYRYRYLETRSYPLIAGQQLVVSLAYVAGFVVLFQFADGTPAAFFAYCFAVLLYFALIVFRRGRPAIGIGWKDLAPSAAGLMIWTSVFAAQAAQSSARFIDRAFASTIGDGYFAVIDVIYAAMAGVTLLPLGIFNIFAAAHFAGRSAWQRKVSLLISAGAISALAIALPFLAGIGASEQFAIAGIPFSAREAGLALIAPIAFMAGTLGFQSLLALGESRAAFAIVALKMGAKLAYLLTQPQVTLFDIVATIVVTEALASLLSVWRFIVLRGRTGKTVSGS